MSTKRARELRKNQTEAERTLWKHLRLRQFGAHKFRRQAPIGPYIVDFVCFENGLVIELDGGDNTLNKCFTIQSVPSGWNHKDSMY